MTVLSRQELMDLKASWVHGLPHDHREFGRDACETALLAHDLKDVVKAFLGYDPGCNCTRCLSVWKKLKAPVCEVLARFPATELARPSSGGDTGKAKA